MKSTLFPALVLAAALLVPAMSSAQFGHPLKGQWSGEWGPKDKPRRLLLDLHWDGKAITGSINPGNGDAVVRNVSIDYSNVSAWKVKLDAERKDSSGKPVRIVAEGTLENIGAYFRVFHGTWTEGNQKGEFTVTRN
jgi:hypothetical protein